MPEPTGKLKVFLCHASEDKPIVRELYERLRADGFAPWLDSEALLPEQDWDLEIQKAMRASDAVIVCFSSISVSKEGYVQKEIKYAQEIQQEKPEGTIFFIPLQLEACEMPFRLRGIHWRHYYEPDGYEKLVQALNVRAGQVKAREGTMRSQRQTSAKQETPETGSTNSIGIGGSASQSVMVAGAGNVINVHYGAPIASVWRRPAAPRPSKPMVGRKEDFNKVAEWLKSGRNAAITAAVQGTPGVGKTVLAEHLAAALDGDFPGGVIYEPLGSTFRDPQLATPLLEKWAAFGGWIRQENRPPAPEEVRALLSGHGALLVVLDDVWDLDAVQPLLQALPKEACLLITTRSRRIAQELHGEIYPLDVLTDDDARELLKRRAHPTDAEMPLLERLAKALGNHAQALDIAAGSLARLPHNRWKAAVEEMERQVREGSGFGELHLTDDEEKEGRVEAALAFSYSDLKPETRKRFRSLGAFAPDASFGAEAAARIWNLESVEEAENQLTALHELGLLGYAPQSPNTGRGVGGEGAPRWQQHSILRAYALALLKKEGEEESARNAHAQTYNELMRQADDRQTYFLLLPDYPQLQHAFAWAIEHDFDLAGNLAGNTANLQAAFSLVRESYSWAKQLVEKSRDQDENTKGAAIRTLGNALWRLASLPGEERRARLLAALAAYDEALQYLRPDTAPLDYAATQNNRGAVLRALAASPGEDRRARLLAALAAYDEALQYLRPDTAPLDYAMTQNNRGLALQDLAASPGEERRARLLDALAAYDEALRFYRPDTAPLAYAMTQNNRGVVLSDLAASPGEERRARLLDALAAYDEALLYRRPDTAPLAYAMTQNNRGVVLQDLAASPGEDRRARLLEALAAYDEALLYRRPDTAPLAYAGTQNNRGLALQDLAASPGEDRRARLLAALAAYDEALRFYRPDTAPLDYAMTQGNLGILHMELRQLPGEEPRRHFAEAIQCVWRAYSLFQQIGHAPYEEWAKGRLAWLREQDAILFDELWKELNLGPLPF